MITLPERDGPTGADAFGAAGNANNVVLRIASAVVLVPVTIATAYVGGWLFLIVCALTAGGILWEWMRLIGHRSDGWLLLPGLAALFAALAFAGANEPGVAAGMIALGAVVTGAMAGVKGPDRHVLGDAVWSAGGVFYAGVAFLSPALLRQDPALGFVAVLFLAVTVWLTDTFAYCIGRAAGGPLLWPRVSPKKTWSGAVGGLIGGVAGGILVAYASGIGRLAVLGVIALSLSVIAQVGDLLESAIKRHFGAKDTSQIIPGHGGLMDRLDGLLLAALAALLIGVLRQGAQAPAHGLLVW